MFDLLGYLSDKYDTNQNKLGIKMIWIIYQNNLEISTRKDIEGKVDKVG